MLPTVVTEARRTFTDDLEARGFRDVERGRSQRVRTESGDRARLAKVTASYPLESDAADRLEIEGWLGVWHGSGFRIAGGAYPVDGLEGLLPRRRKASGRRRTRTTFARRFWTWFGRSSEPAHSRCRTSPRGAWQLASATPDVRTVSRVRKI
ncbi:hypothetical protein ACFQER_04650 [Halomicroarcula sp. GCM10025894]|uniref:hypothetical protein n=1 Tax=Halomicroarcula sp. GCM10025894 TaxID=3252673 RepID=UPI003616AEC9